jgi:predicted transcriptional regulator
LLRTTTEINIDKVLIFIQQNPGCHFRLIKRQLGISVGTVQYHVNRLEKAMLICSSKLGFFKCYFPAEIFQDFDKEILQILIQERTREILLLILEKQTPTQSDIVNKIGISPASVNWHVQRLISAKVIREIRDGRFKRYQVLEDPYNSRRKRILTLMKNCYPSIWDKWSNRLTKLILAI